MLISAKLAPAFEYSVLEEFWRSADELGFHAVWNYDHFYGLGGNDEGQTLEGWTTLAAMATITQRARIGVMVTGITYRHPSVLAHMAVTVDHISAGRLEFGIGAAWHESEHKGLGIDFPSPGVRVAMLDEALDIVKGIWSGERPTIKGRFWSIENAICEPRPVQKPYPRVVIGGTKPKILRVIAKHADEWNCIDVGAENFTTLSKQLDEACAEVGRDPAAVRRSVQFFVHPQNPGSVEETLAKIPEFEKAGAEHAVLSFYQPPMFETLEQCAPR